jgi:hypothetical protein
MAFISHELIDVGRRGKERLLTRALLPSDLLLLNYLGCYLKLRV